MNNADIKAIIERLNKGQKLENEYLEKIVESLNQEQKLEDLARKFNISKSALNKQLNSSGYKYNKDLSIWFDINQEGIHEFIKEQTITKYLDDIDEMGSNRYYGGSDDYVEEYISDPCVDFRWQVRNVLLEELKKIAREKGIKVDWLLEYMILKQIKKERKRDPEKITLEIMEEEYRELGYDENEIKFLENLKNVSDDMFNSEEDICIYWGVYLYLKGYNLERIRILYDKNMISEEYESLKDNTNLENFAEKKIDEYFKQQKDYFTNNYIEVSNHFNYCSEKNHAKETHIRKAIDIAFSIFSK